MSPAFKPRVILPLLLVAGLLLYYFFFNPVPQLASLILTNGVVYTVYDQEPRAEAIALRDGRIVGVGAADRINAAFRSDRVIDLQGKPVYPGFIDCHAHLEALGALLRHLDLTVTTSPQEVLDMVAREVPKTPPGVWIRGMGWNQNSWASKRLPTSAMLDKVSPDVPVYLRRIDGHAVWVNGKALTIAGISASTPDPEGGTIVRDTRGKPTGVFLDNAIALLDSSLPTPSPAERMSSTEAGIRGCVHLGLTGVHDMGADLEGIRIYKELIQSGRFPFRVYVALDRSSTAWEHYRKEGPEIGIGDDRLTVRAVELYADGPLESREAALIEPYGDDPGNRGFTLVSADALEQAALQALKGGFQLCIDAHGDRANSLALQVIDKTLALGGKKVVDPRFRLEYVQVLESSDFSRFNRLGVLPVMLPTETTSNIPWAENRLGPARASRAWAWRSLLDSGSIIPTGSDFPFENPNPLWRFYSAITRQEYQGSPDGAWHPEQRMSREEALKGCTVWAAYAAFEEKKKGTIEQGKLADLVILSDDIMRIPPHDILSCTVEATIVGGEFVYSSPSFAQTLASLTR
jgi:predicted amidohydrolase YtcJ